MGRILRKKQPSLKKKKKLDADKAEADTNSGLGAGTGAVAVEPKPKALAVAKKAYPQSAAAVAAPPADNVVTRTLQYLREVKIELKKVTWPSRKQTLGSTLVVLILVVLISLFLGVVDLGLSGLVRAIFR